MGKIKDIELFTLIHDFFKTYLPDQRKASLHTIRAYQKSLDGLLDYASAQKGISLCEPSFAFIDHDMLLGYLDHLEKNGCSIGRKFCKKTGLRLWECCQKGLFRSP